MIADGSLGRWKTPLLAAVMVVAVALRLVAFDQHRTIDFDEGRYLDNAYNILRGRGLSSNYTSHFFRSPSEAPALHAEDMSSPLFPILLAGTFAVSGIEPAEAHRAAQLWSLVPGCLLVLLVFGLGRRLFDDRTALLASALVALNPDLVILSSWAMTESLFACLFVGILWLESRASSAWRWPVLGASCGVLYLLRGNGLAVAAVIGVLALRPSLPWRRSLWCASLFAIPFLLVVSPWLVRNQMVFGSPTYSAMKHVGWTESGRDLFTRSESPPSMARFRAEHGDVALARNVARRAWRAGKYLIWGDTGAYNFLCLLYPAALLLTWRADRLRAGHLCVLFSTVLLVGVHVWTGALSRYLLPVRPWIYLTVMGALVHLVPELAWVRSLRERGGQAGGATPGMVSSEPLRRLSAALAATLVGIIAWNSVGPLRGLVSADRGPDLVKDALARETAQWVADRTPPGAVLMEGAFIHQYAYLFDRPVVWVPTGGMGELMRTASDYGASYLLVSEDLLRFRPDLRESFTSDDAGVGGRGLPDGFQEVYATPGRQVVIWRLPGAGT